MFELPRQMWCNGCSSKLGPEDVIWTWETCEHARVEHAHLSLGSRCCRAAIDNTPGDSLDAMAALQEADALLGFGGH